MTETGGALAVAQFKPRAGDFKFRRPAHNVAGSPEPKPAHVTSSDRGI